MRALVATLLLTACIVQPAPAPGVPPDASGYGACVVPSTLDWLELLGIRLCDGPGLCPGGDVYACRQEVERLAPAGNFCPERL